MKKAKTILTFITLFGVLGSTLAFKIAERTSAGRLLYVTTEFNYTAIQTFANAVTVAFGGQGNFRFYTSLKYARATIYSKLTINL